MKWTNWTGLPFLDQWFLSRKISFTRPLEAVSEWSGRCPLSSIASLPPSPQPQPLSTPRMKNLGTTVGREHFIVFNFHLLNFNDKTELLKFVYNDRQLQQYTFYFYRQATDLVLNACFSKLNLTGWRGCSPTFGKVSCFICYDELKDMLNGLVLPALGTESHCTGLV